MSITIREVTLPTKEQVFKSDLDIFMTRKDRICLLSDFAILMGSCTSENPNFFPIRSKINWWYCLSENGNRFGKVRTSGSYSTTSCDKSNGGIRPVLKIAAPVMPNEGYINSAGLVEVEFGEYPQFAVDPFFSNALSEQLMHGNLKETGKTYTQNAVFSLKGLNSFDPKVIKEYEYKGKKYVVAISDAFNGEQELSNGMTAKMGSSHWVEVAPIKWIYDKKSMALISKIALASGIRPTDSNGKYHGYFKTTEMYSFLNDYFLKEIVATKNNSVEKQENSKCDVSKKSFNKNRNPYGFNINNVSEEDIIRGCIESNISVFLHGPSSEGKSARVKQIDPECEIIYLRNASPESLNGKSVYNRTTGEMIDVKPTWLIRLEEKCKKEPNKKHILFFDEITNALPSIQGIAFNIVLDKEVNGKWKLPDNARIVAAGNEMKDSLSANQLAEPLFNRFAHVYIKTTTESWLKWASENNIHPAIYSYIAYKKGETLRSKYDGKKPNADPRKWEMASKMLYSTQNPQMLRSLIGEDITREFVEFCNQRVITVEDVVNGNYTDKDIEELNTSERYATTMGLSQVDEDNLEKVREFVSKIGAEFTSIFDQLWTHNDESRLEKIAEINFQYSLSLHK